MKINEIIKQEEKIKETINKLKKKYIHMFKKVNFLMLKKYLLILLLLRLQNL
jgi:hypothetical protein